MNQLQRLFGYTRPYRGRLVAAFVAMLAYAAGSLLVARQIQPIFDKVLPHQQDLAGVVTLIIVGFFVKGVGDYISGYMMAEVGQRVVMDLRNQLFRHVLGQSATFFARRTTGQLMSRITNDVSQVQFAVTETLADFLRESLTLGFYTTWLFWLDWKLAVLCLTALPLVVYGLWRLGQRVRKTTRRGQAELEHVTHIATEALTGNRIVKAFGAEDREADRFRRSAFALYGTYMKATAALSGLPPLMEMIGSGAAVGALWFGTQEIASGTLSPGIFTEFLFIAFNMYGPIKKLSRVNASLQQTIAACERIFDMLDTHTEVPDRPGALPLARLERSVEFRDVGFAYADDPSRWTLRHVSFTARAGQVVAIVGLSGAGKSTLANLIPRFFDVKEGGILIDDVDIRAVSLTSLRGAIALVTQDTVLFDESIAYNIAYGMPTASREAIEAAARAAHAHDFIVNQAGGYAAQIGERGQRLSGGQRQRLAIARAILKDAPLLVLDEATSSLDVESESLVQDALANLMRNRTTFVIAHRLSTVRHADFIVALEDGQVVEIGPHDVLVNKPNGLYAKLYALQAFDEGDADDDDGDDEAGESAGSPEVRT